jgi:hypothetical protein
MEDAVIRVVASACRRILDFDDDRAIDEIRTGGLQAPKDAGRNGREYQLRLLQVENLSDERAADIFCRVFSGRD